MDFIQELKSRLETKRKEWDRARLAAREAREREAQLGAEITALQRVLESELAGQKAGNQHIRPTIVTPTDASDTTSVAEVVRSLIRDSSPSGLTPSQIRQLLKERKLETGKNYLYAILLRAKKAGKVSERGGRYFVDEAKKEAAS